MRFSEKMPTKITVEQVTTFLAFRLLNSALDQLDFIYLRLALSNHSQYRQILLKVMAVKALNYPQ